MSTYLKHSHMAKRRYTSILFHTLRNTGAAREM